MAIGDYILCCKCEVKLIYDGDRPTNREWWKERFGEEPEIECPNCKPKREWNGLTYGELFDCQADDPYKFFKAIEAKLKQKNGYAEEKNT